VHLTLVGAGVVGLTVALRLADDGHRVRVLADRPVEQTTSTVAAALWYPYLAGPADRTRRWGSLTYRVLADLARTTPEAGVDCRWGREVLAAPTPVPDWQADVEGFTATDTSWSFLAPVADMAVYLPWLTDQARDRGVEVQTVPRVDRAGLERLAAGSDGLVLFPRLGARDLVGDDAVTPVRGQVVLLEQTGVTEWLLAAGDGPPGALTYVVPRRSHVVCGGTALPDRWDTDPEPETAEAILARCRRLVPALADAAVVAHRVGLRPVRPDVRVELDDGSLELPAPVVHCYGHGGAGVTLSWGCAQDVVALVRTVA
jgi:D-amino-acid oxidase